MRTTSTLVALAALALAACAPAPLADKGAEEDEPIDGAFDSFRSPIDHGELTLGVPVSEELTRSRSFHAWTFELTGDADVVLRTSEGGPGREVDTMLYLYREGPRGWGSYIARNDDTGGTLFSALTRSLGAGRYRVLVKGYTRSSAGPFVLESECSGAGCPGSEPMRACLFGETFGDIGSVNGVVVANEETLTTVEQLFEPVQREQLVLALQQSSHTDVTTAEEAFLRVDGGTVRRLWLYDAAGSRSFVAYEYGAGDNSYGAIFVQGGTTRVSAIHDGDLAMCTVHADTCLFGGSYRAMRDSAAFEPLLSMVIRDASAATGARAAQLVAAVQVAYADAADVASALASVDGGEVNLLEVRELATGRTFRAYEYGAGDNSYGALFEGESASIAARIADGDLYDCAVFGPAQGARAGADCGIGEEGPVCAEGLACQGYVESWGAGRCAPSARVEGEGESCSASVACASPSLICAGLTRGDEGFCVPSWMRGGVSVPGPVSIPDGSASGLVSVGTVYGLASVDMDVEIRALLQHPRHEDLRITLTNPSGNEVLVFEAEPGSGPLELDGPLSGFSGDEDVNGAWTLRVVDSRRGSAGTLERWAVDVTSRWD